MPPDRDPLIGRINDDRAEDENDEERPGVFATYVRPCVAELVGTALFVTVGTMSAVAGQGGVVQVALAHGLTIAVLVIMLGGISGGHFNPAVTLGVAVCGGMKWTLAPLYVLCQLLGSVLGAVITKGVYSSAAYSAAQGGSTVCADGVTAWQGVLTELVLTSLLVSAVLVAAVGYKHPLAPMSIGLALTVSILAGGAVSGSSLNPARSLGPAVVSGTWDKHWIYWAGPVVGSLLASLMYRLVFGTPRNRLIF